MRALLGSPTAEASAARPLSRAALPPLRPTRGQQQRRWPIPTAPRGLGSRSPPAGPRMEVDGHSQPRLDRHHTWRRRTRKRKRKCAGQHWNSSACALNPSIRQGGEWTPPCCTARRCWVAPCCTAEAGRGASGAGAMGAVGAPFFYCMFHWKTL